MANTVPEERHPSQATPSASSICPKSPETPEPFFNGGLVEKIVMVSLVSIIFAQVLPGVQAGNLEVAVGVALVIAINTALSHWLARRGTEWRSIVQQFIVMAAVNFGLVLVYAFLLPRFDGSINLGNTLFFVLLLTLLVTLYDRYRPVYLSRFAAAES